MRVQLYIEGKKLTLFESETIDLKSSVQDVNDISKNTTDYTKNFKVPADSVNNIIFKHYYDTDIDNGFDARTKKEARLELDGLVFRYGKISLLSVEVKKGKPESYSIVFYGNAVNIKDEVGDDYISELPLTQYDHAFTSDNVRLGLTDGLFDSDIVYSLMAKKQYYYNSSSSDHTDTELLTNIAYHSAGHSNVHGVRFSDLNPSIKLIRLIEAIEEKYNITFTRDFFGRALFDNLYMWVSSNDKDSNENVVDKLNFDSGDTNFDNGSYIDLSTDICYFNFSSTKTYGHEININPTDDSISYSVRTYINDTLFSVNEYTGDSANTISTYDFNPPASSGTYELRYEIEAPDNFVYSAFMKTYYYNGFFGSETPDGIYTTVASSQSLSGLFNVANNLPKLKVIDFLKGLFSAFKLVVIHKNPNDAIYINTLKDYYSEGVVYDLTKYIDTSSHKVSRGDLFNTISYTFKEPETILNAEFLNNTGLGYGDAETILEGEDGQLLDGGSLSVTVPFEQVVYERLNDINDNSQTNVQYGAIIDDGAEATNIEAHIHYVVSNDLTDKPISFIDQNNNQSILNSAFIPSHTDNLETPLNSFIFSSEYSTFTGNSIYNTLYKNWHADFISSVFNNKRRTFNYTAYTLPYRYLMSLDLNDVVQIKNNFFRINSFNTNLINGKVTLELINSFDNVLNPFDTNDAVMLFRQEASTDNIYINDLESKSITLVDEGFGVDWLTTEVSRNLLNVTVTENTTSGNRYATISVQNEAKTKEKRILIKQDLNNLTYGNTEVTWGDTAITFNN